MKGPSCLTHLPATLETTFQDRSDDKVDEAYQFSTLKGQTEGGLIDTRALEMTNPTAEGLAAHNAGVYINASHDLWVAEAAPSLEDVRSGTGLQPGEVTIAVKATGICG